MFSQASLSCVKLRGVDDELLRLLLVLKRFRTSENWHISRDATMILILASG